MNVSEVKSILNDNGIRLSKKRGQNFLVEEGVINSLLSTLAVSEKDNILEIGTGLGALTEKLAAFNAFVYSYEIDKGVFNLVAKRFAGSSNVKIIHQDFLKTDIKKSLPSPLRVIANIPYNIASQILIKLWLSRDHIRDMYLLVQKEFGERIAASESSRESSILSVILSLDYEIKIVKKVSPHAFFPPPSVDSVYLGFKSKDNIIANDEREDFFSFVKYGFAQRRKKLLPRLIKLNVNAAEAFADLGLADKLRAENLKSSDWLNLYRLLKKG